jgi:hypothetical protein
MTINWAFVKKKTLWSYEDLIKKMLYPIKVPFVLEQYNHTMGEAEQFAKKIQAGYLGNEGGTNFIDDIVDTFRTLRDAEVENYLELLTRVETKEKCEHFLANAGIGFEGLVEALNYLFRWVLPFKIPLRELIDVEDKTQRSHFETLKLHGVKSNLDLLEQCRRKVGRVELCEATGVPEAFLLELAHRADISRLAYVRGKTVMHLCGGGYDTLAKIADADLKGMEAEMEAYYQTLGKKSADFKAVIPLEWMIGGARILPKVMEK